MCFNLSSTDEEKLVKSSECSSNDECGSQVGGVSFYCEYCMMLDIHIFVLLSRSDTFITIIFLIGRKPWEAFSDDVVLIHY